MWEIDGETYTQRGDFFLSHIFFREPGSANACTPLQAVSSEMSEMPLIGCLSLAQLSILWLDWLNLIVWFFWLHTWSTGLLWRTAIVLFTNHNVTACQNTWGHEERTENPCWEISWLSLFHLKKFLNLKKKKKQFWWFLFELHFWKNILSFYVRRKKKKELDIFHSTVTSAKVFSETCYSELRSGRSHCVVVSKVD